MKNIFLVALLIVLTSCANYETIRDKFTFKGEKDFDYIGANVTQKKGVPINKYQSLKGVQEMEVTKASSYEITINAPEGSSINSAMVMFDDEAEKICGGNNYRKQITSTGTDVIREFGMKKVEQIRVPQVKGIVTCL